MADIVRRAPLGANLPSLFEPSFRWDPFEVMREMLEPLREMAGAAPLATFTPRFEVRETKDAYVFKGDLPGVDEKDLDISLTGNRLSVSGKREAERHEEGESWYTAERSYGSFCRTFTLPAGADPDNAHADLRDGVLTLTVGKRAEAQPRKISVKGIAEKVKGALGGEKAKA